MYYLKQIPVKIPDQPQDLCLTITDNIPLARRLKEEGRPVTIYLHEGNRGEDLSDFLYAVEEPEEVDDWYAERVCRRCLQLPWNIAETDRCLIRETTVEDVDSFFEIYSHPAITRYMEDLYPKKEQEREYVREYIKKVYAFYEFGVWTVLEKESSAVIGRAGFSFREGYSEPELGFIIGVPWQRKGYAEEVCRALLKYGKEILGFQTVQVLVEPQNTPSLQLCNKLGFWKKGLVTVENKEYVRQLLRL